MTPELQSRIAHLNGKAAAGIPLSREEMREAISLLREARGAAAASTRTSTRAKALGISTVDVKGALDGLKNLKK